jgi:hypothetical protein
MRILENNSGNIQLFYKGGKAPPLPVFEEWRKRIT